MDKQKTVAVFGGSFNPPHEGHLQMAMHVDKTLDVDETWLLFSMNPYKNPDHYASLTHRMNMADILVRHYDASLVLSGLEEDIARETGHHETFYVLNGLQKRFPNTQFIWVMGADSFANFHAWDERDDILRDYVVAVVDRPGFTAEALHSPTARLFQDQMIDISPPHALRDAGHGWCFLPDGPQCDASSSSLLADLRAGRTDFAEPFQQVANYIRHHNLYQGACPT